jgi:DNA polymerase III epsilon subunit-like protein
MSDRYVIIDTEGTGLFSYKDAADAPGQPRVASVAMIFLDREMGVKEEFFTLIKPEGWTFDDNSDAAKINGLTQAKLDSEGVPISSVLARYTDAVKAGYVMVAHNAQHDLKHMRAELRRAQMDDMFMVTRNICTMRAMTDVCQLMPANGRAGFKFPKLAEALAYIGVPVADEGAHTAMGDARGALEITRWLAKNQMLPMAGVHLAKKKPDLVPTPRRSSGKPKPAAAGDEIPA